MDAVVIVIIVVAALVLLAVLVLVARRGRAKRHETRRVEAGEIRSDAKRKSTTRVPRALAPRPT